MSAQVFSREGVKKTAGPLKSKKLPLFASTATGTKKLAPFAKVRFVSWFVSWTVKNLALAFSMMNRVKIDWSR